MVETPIMIPAIHHFRYQPLININAHTRDWPRATAAQQFVDQCGGWMMTGKYYAAILYHTPGNNL